MASRIRLYDRSGTLIYEPSAPAFREFVLNDIGNASFAIKAAGMEPYIEFGNYITIEHDKLKAFVGKITTARPWASKVITVNAKSAMWIFGQRRGSYQQPVSGSWGAVLSQVLGIANSQESTLMQVGNYFGGVPYSSVVDMSNLYTYLQRALIQAQTRLDFRPEITNGKLKIFIDIQPTLYTTSPLRLEEGLNVKNNSPLLTEQGDIHNDITILSVGLDQTRYTATARDENSIAKYGLHQFLISEGASQSDADRLAVVRLAQYAYPRKTLALTATNKGDTFFYTQTGNSAAVELKTVNYQADGTLGFRGNAYIRVVQFSDQTGEATLVCKEI